MWMITRLLCILFPETCFSCRAPGSSFCKRCISLSRKSLATPAPYITSVFDFKEEKIRRAIHAIKYYRRKDLIHPLSRELALTLQKELPSYASATLVPIPMSRTRRWMRGYNQAELIAQELSGLLEIPYSRLLTRTKTTRRQVKTRTKSERLVNQKGAFTVTESVLPPVIILIDDVTTTGATISEARDTLMKAGNVKVYAATLAH